MRIVATLIMTALALPAYAGSPAPAAPDPVIAPIATPDSISTDWSGFYAGAQLGWGDVDVVVPGVGAFDGDGALGGLHAGYNWDFGSYILGVEGDFDITDITVSNGAGASGDMNYIARLKLRAGTELGNSMLLYGTVGAAYLDVTGGGIDQNDTGWLAGIGLDRKLAGGWIVGGDVIYHEFNDFDFSLADVEATTIRVRVSRRF